MALKVKLSSGMREIDTFVHKPVTFIDGQKKILDVGVTFVNGVKKYLWGKDGVPVDYIKVDGQRCGDVISIGDNWMITAMSPITRFNISNLDNPVVDQSVDWGTVRGYSGFQSGGSAIIFSTTKGNKLSITPSTGAMSVAASYAVPSSSSYEVIPSVCITNSYNCGIISKTSLQSVAVPNYDWYWNGTMKYRTGSTNNKLTWNNTPVIQIDTDSFLINMTQTGSNGVYLATPSAINRVGAIMNDLIMLDGSYICGVANSSSTSTASTFILYDRGTRAAVRTYTHDNATEKLVFLGRIGDNYYFVVCPKDANATSGVKIILLNKDTFAKTLEQDVESDPFEENGGKVTFWYTFSGVNNFNLPTVSNTGFLNYSTYNNSTQKLRCARIGELL